MIAKSITRAPVLSGSDDRTARLRRLNDQLRCYGRGGTLLITAGIRELGANRVASVLAAVRAFDAFTPGNDPYGEHDMSALRVHGTRILWKIDYYDQQRRYASPDPADPAVTARVLTVMLASEY